MNQVVDERLAVPLVLSNTMVHLPNTAAAASYNVEVQHDVDDKFVLMLDNKLAVAPVESNGQRKAHKHKCR